MIIGRSSTADWTIESHEVSRQHIRIAQADGECSVTDMGSHNGTYLNGLKIRSATLKEGDSIQIGNVTFIFQENT
jgi:pSer/pThr/pTyr-binding forkhead associated (FHA) protein